MPSENISSYELERNHMETILNNRFNFLFISVGLFLNAAVQAKSIDNYRCLLFVCLIYTFLLSLTLFRAQARLNFLVDRLKSFDNHPVKETYDHVNNRSLFVKHSVRNLIGYWIPFLTMIILLVLLFIPSLIFG